MSEMCAFRLHLLLSVAALTQTMQRSIHIVSAFLLFCFASYIASYFLPLYSLRTILFFSSVPFFRPLIVAFFPKALTINSSFQLFHIVQQKKKFASLSFSFFFILLLVCRVFSSLSFVSSHSSKILCLCHIFLMGLFAILFLSSYINIFKQCERMCTRLGVCVCLMWITIMSPSLDVNPFN